MLSVVVPTLDESERLPLLLSDLRTLDDVGVEVVVVDGGSRDGTPRVAERLGARVVHAERSRGTQLRAGAVEARGAWLFFVHADCRFPEPAASALREFLRTATEEDFAHFAFALQEPGFFARFIEFGQRLRERALGLVYGDQGLVVSRSLYERAGGYPGWPLMEDVGVIDRLASCGRRTALRAALPTSDRRYRREGRVRAWLRNITLISRYRLGARPEELIALYPPDEATPRNAVAIFAKAPFPGTVKTRLAADVGDTEAVRIYRTIGAETARALDGGRWRRRVYVSPGSAKALHAVASRLEVEPHALRGQTGNNLGERLHAAVRAELADADRVIVVGTDIPGIHAETADRAFRALDEADVVVGPATDGGYWLIGMKSAHGALFRGIPWSTSSVLERTLDAARHLGLHVALLEPKTDVDTASDVPSRYADGTRTAPREHA